MADTDVANEPVFRANKRRKVFRKRRESEENAQAEIAEASEGNASAANRAAEEADDGEGSAPRLHRRAGVRKTGIGFSSTDARRTTHQQDTSETALVPINQDVAQEVQIDRFTKPVGREVVTEDRYMMAYVDSKLAEMRSAASPANATQDELDVVPSARETALAATTDAAANPDERGIQAVQARSDRVYQRPTKRPRRKKYERGEADIARDAYIDQFMQEAQVPMYDRSSARATGTDANGDNDVAAAEAFKAQLLADMETHRRRPPKSASAQNANVTSGPKLGGSRQQREKMRALQEAEGKK